MLTKRRFAAMLLALVVAVQFTSCKKDDNKDTKEVSSANVKENYAAIVYASYKDAKDKAEVLRTAINTFVETPTAANQDAAKNAWLEAREPYGQTEAYRFYGGPIDDEDGPEGLLNAWPLDESYIDYTIDPASPTDTVFGGIINQTEDYPNITASLLENANEAEGEKSISVGYHAIEFLLWGQDLTAPSEKKAGLRTEADFDAAVDNGKVANKDRRGEYINVCADLLVQHLESLVAEWTPNTSGNYRSNFVNLTDNEAFQKIFTAIGVLSKSELAGERIYVAYDNKDQEDEHSCFSDNTHRDIYLNFKGISNVYLGEYGSISGASLSDKVKAVNATKDEEIRALITKIDTEIKAMATPFDFAISDEASRPGVLAVVQDLQTLGDKFTEAAVLLGLTVEIPE